MRNSRNMTRPAALAAAVVIAIGGITTAGAASLSASRFAEVGQATALRSGDAINGMVSFTQPIHIEVALKMRDRAGLDAFIESAHAAQKSTGMRPMLSTDDFMARHAPSEDQAKAVSTK